MTAHLDTLTWLLNKVHTLGADAADAVLFDTVDLSTSRRMRNPEGLERSESKAVGLRAFKGKQQAMVSSSDTGRDALTELAERAIAMAKAAPPDPDCGLASVALHAKKIPELDLFDGNEPHTGWLDEQCNIAEETALSVEGITNSEGADAGYSVSKICLASGNGSVNFAHEYATSYFQLSTSVVAGSGTDMQRDYDFSSVHHRNDLTAADVIGKNAAEWALKRLHPCKIASCKVPVIFDPRISRNLVGILAGAISGSSVARGSSFLKGDLHKQIFSKHITIIDDPHIKRGLASKPFDGECVQNKKMELVENGILKTWLLDIRTASKLKMTTTGHAARGVSSPPSPSSTNLYMQNGSVTPESLIKEIKGGLYVTETFGMGVNTVTGDYSQGASGFWIENGEITYPVSEITIAGNLRDMYMQLTPANDLEFRYSTNAPTVRIDSMTVAGT